MQSMQGLLQQLQSAILEKKDNLSVVESKFLELSKEMQESTSVMANIVDTLKSANVNPIANYYWLLFVFIYAGAYFFQ